MKRIITLVLCILFISTLIVDWEPKKPLLAARDDLRRVADE